MTDAERRAAMLRAIERDAGDTGALTGRSTFSPAVMAAMGRVPRHEFVQPGDAAMAYDNAPLPIGHGQTISQPFIVALMTELLDLQENAWERARLLEVGTGCGYQAAVLAELAKEVCTVEIVEPLALRAKERLRRLGYDNVEVRVGDGYAGWPEHAPYDGVLVTAAAPSIPAPLIEQLAPRAKLVIPIGPPGGSQQLMVVRKRADGGVDETQVLPVAFVPLTGERDSARPQ